MTESEQAEAVLDGLDQRDTITCCGHTTRIEPESGYRADLSCIECHSTWRYKFNGGNPGWFRTYKDPDDAHN